MNKNIIKIALTVFLFAALAAVLPGAAMAATIPYWNLASTSWDLSFVATSGTTGTYEHHMDVTTQDSAGNFAGTGYYVPDSSYTWVIDSGSSVSGNSVHLLLHYTGGHAVSWTTTADAIIASNGSLSSGTWTDNQGNGGTWNSNSGTAAALGSLAAQDFGVVNYDSGGNGILAGYTAGFGLTDATFADVSSVVVKLYAAGDVLMQTDTATAQVWTTLTGNQISSPFDVSGSFNYGTDGYWTNVRATQYGQSVPAVKVVATVTLDNGQVVTATNTTLSGPDPSTIYPVAVVVTNPATVVTSTGATLNGTNGNAVANNEAFWYGTATPPAVGFVPAVDDASSQYPSGWVGAFATTQNLAAGGAFNLTPSVLTPGTKYYFVAWSFVGNTWYPGAVLNFTTLAAPAPQTATLTLVKKVDCNNKGSWWKNKCDAPTDWTLSADGPTSITGVTGSAAVTRAIVNAGDYVLSEPGALDDDASDYVAGAWSCVINSDGAPITPTVSTDVSASVTLNGGDVATCTITNTRITTPPSGATGAIKVVKYAIGGTGTDVFNFAISGSTSKISITPKLIGKSKMAEGSNTFTGLKKGTYSISETLPVGSNWRELNPRSCQNVRVQPGRTTTCVIVNVNNKSWFPFGSNGNGGIINPANH